MSRVLRPKERNDMGAITVASPLSQRL